MISPAAHGQAPPAAHESYRVKVVMTNADEDMRTFNQLKASVSSVAGDVAELYVSPEQLLWLAADGYTITVIEREPRPPAFATIPKGLSEYHSYESLTTLLQSYAAAFGAGQAVNPDICRLVSLGRSVQGRELWAILITDNPDAEEIEPEFKYVAAMHGNEIACVPISVYFIDYLLNHYETNRRVKRLVNRTAIWVVPLMNPDGYVAGTRANANGVDLNRNFPAWPEQYSGTIFDGAPVNTEGREPETRHVMEWTAANSFVLSANFHTGARLVNYPYDDDDKGSFVDAPSPDDLLFEDISLRYSMPNTPMYTNPVPYFPGGIVNGSLWYEIVGGMQDWNYRYAGCNEVTIELTPQSPPSSGLPALWNENRESMLAYAEAAHIGVRGVVRDKWTGEPLYAQIKVQGNPQRVYTDPDMGDYYRMLLPGTYRLRYSAPGYRSKTREVTVAGGRAVRVNVRLRPASR